MSITLFAGWWIIPLGVSIVAFAWALHQTPATPGTYGSNVLYAGFLHLVALATSLAAWLAWAVLT